MTDPSYRNSKGLGYFIFVRSWRMKLLAIVLIGLAVTLGFTPSPLAPFALAGGVYGLYLLVK